MAIVIKKSGDLRICIDPKPLNEALRREHFQLPPLEDLLSELSGAKYFTKVDLSSVFWHLELDESPVQHAFWTIQMATFTIWVKSFQRDISKEVEISNR